MKRLATIAVVLGFCTGIIMSAAGALNLKWAPKGGVSYLLRDEFNTDLAAGSVNGTAAEPGPGTRTVTDTGNRLSLSGGKAVTSSGGVWGDPGLWYGAITRTAGRFLIAEINLQVTSDGGSVGWGKSQSGVQSGSSILRLSSTAPCQVYEVSIPSVIPALSVSTSYRVVIVLRSTGAYYFIKGGVYTNATLLWVGPSYSDATLYPFLAPPYTLPTFNYLRVPTNIWLPTPLAYSTFTGANGAALNMDATGPDGQSYTAPSWTAQVGTQKITGNAAIAATTDTVSIATVPLATADVMISSALTKGTTGDGVVLRYQDADNYFYGWHNGTNAILQERAAGAEGAALISAAGAYAAGRILVVGVSGNDYRLYYNNVLIGTGTDASLNTVKNFGVYFKDTDSTQDNFQAFAKGTGNEYSALDNF